jgi:cobalt-zinc-cadmium efflux system outer membrane protein
MRPQQDPRGDISVDQAIALALAANPGLAAASLDVQAADANLFQQGLLPNPELEAEVEEFGGTGEFESFDVAEYTVIIGQEIPLGGARGKRLRIAALGRDLVAWEHERIRREVIGDARIAFIDVLATQKDLALVAQLVALAEELRATVQKRVTAGAAANVEQLKAAVELSAIRNQRKRADRTLETAREKLAITWGSSSARFARATGNLEQISPPPKRQQVVGGLSANPDLACLPAVIDQRNAELELERARRFASLQVAGGWKWVSETEDQSFIASVALPLPIFDRNQGGIRRAAFELERTRQEAKAKRVATVTAFARAYRDLVSSHREALSLKRELLPIARESFDATTRAFRDGRLPYIEVLDAQRTLFEAHREYGLALVRYHKAVVDVERIAGHSSGTPIQKSD